METPGTISRILWHFTGGPVWDDELHKQKPEPKPLTEAYSILKSIIKSKEIRLSNYKENLKVAAKEGGYRKVSGNFESARVCCLADIPLRHLNYHSNRYGKCAIGFYRQSALTNGFNPIFYSLQNSTELQNIYSGLTDITDSGTEESFDLLLGYMHDYGENHLIDSAESTVDDIKMALADARSSIETLSAFIKTFDQSEFATIYCEREWRSLLPFKFKETDIAMVVLPGGQDYYNDLKDSRILSDKIPIVPWEDLIEH